MPRHHVSAVTLSITLCSLAGSAAALSLEPPKVQPLLVVERAALKDWVVDSRDDGLGRAVGMIPARLRELPREIPNFPPEAAPVIDLGINIISNPGRMAITYNVDNPGAGLFGYGLTFSVDSGSRAAAEKMQSTILDLIKQAERERGNRIPLVDSQKFAGMKAVQFPFGSLDFGPRNAEGKWWYDIAFGAVQDPAQGFDALPRPLAGVQPLLRGRLDFAGLNPALDIARGFAGQQMEQAEPIIDELAKAGLIGENALKIDFQTGYSADASVSQVVIHGARRTVEYLGLPSDSLSANDFRAVPTNAVMASLARMDLNHLDTLLDRLIEWGVPVDDFLGEFEDHTGVDLRADVLRAIGGTMISYMSDETGGGGLASTVMLISYKDRARFLGAHDKLLKLANDSIQENGREFGRYVQLARWKHEGVDLISLRFRGVPVPFELTYAATQDWFILGPTPQAVIAAARQASGKGDLGLAVNPAVTAALGRHPKIDSIAIYDSPRLARDGYAIVSFIGSAIANGVRSPHNDRDPGLVVPVYSDLVKGLKPSVQYSFWEGDNWVMEAFGDRSLLAQGAVDTGYMMKFAPIIALVSAASATGAAQQRFGFADLQHIQLADAVEAARFAAFVDPAERVLLSGLLMQAGEQASWRRRLENLLAPAGE